MKKTLRSNNKNIRIPFSFLLLWAGQAVSALGSSATSYALILWAYDKMGTATSITWLSACSYIPSIFFCFAAGVLVDRLDKKKIMLFADLTAFFCTFTVYILYLIGALQVWHLYVVNFTVSCTSAFQNPASYVATSLLVSKEQYMRIGGLQAFSGAVVSILPPVFATAMLSFAGIKLIFLVDFATFFFVFFSLLFFIKIPAAPKSGKEDASFFKNCILGLRFLKEHRVLLRLILFFAGINFLASLAGTQLLPALILPRSGQNSAVLGAVSSAVGIGSLAGSVLVTILPTPRRRMPVIFISLHCRFCCAISRGRSDKRRGFGLWRRFSEISPCHF